MDRLISLEPSSTVAVRIEPGSKCFGVVTLRNVMHTMPVAFRLQAVNATRYTVKPQSGIIPPLCTSTVEITYSLPPGLVVPESFPRCHDSFLLHSVVVPGAAARDSASAPVPTEWFTTRRKQVFIDSGIKVMFVGSPVIAQLVANGSMDEIREVLERSDPDWRAVDSVDRHGQTLLHLAIAQGRPDLVQLLLEFEPDVEAPSRGGAGSSPLEAASAAGEALIVEILLARRASTERSEGSLWGPVHVAAAAGHVDVLKLLLRKGAGADSPTRDGSTALHLAVEERRRDCARLLLAAGASPDARRSGDGDAPLHVAAAMGDEAMVKLLLHKGANKDVRNHGGLTAYDVAAESGHARLFDALRLGDGLCAAARKGETRAVHKLLENGAAVNGRDQNGWTALHRASFKGRLDTVRALIDKGIEVDAKDVDGYTALHCAAESGHVDVIELLIKRGADVEARTNKGVTGLQIAQSLQYAGVARVLGYGGAPSHPFKIMYGADTVSFGDEKTKAPMKRRPGRGRAVRGGEFGQSLALAVL